MRFKVGDRVRVVNVSHESRKGALGAIGIVVDVDGEWSHPYDIDFEKEEFKKFNEELFLEKELVLAGVEKSKRQSQHININFQKSFDDVDGASVEDVIDVLIQRAKDIHNSGHSSSLDLQMNNINIVSRLTEAKMWMRETRKYYEKLENSVKESGEQ